MAERAPISLIILTYNEELNIEHALESVQGWVGEIIIVDSFSTDRTLDICRQYGATIHQHAFETQAKQFNWALDHVPIAHDWILRLDADEMVTPELADELGRVLPTLGPDVTGISMKRRVYCLGRWIKHGAYYPTWFVRAFRKGKGRYEEITEEHIVLADGTAVRLQHDFIDYNRKGLSFWTEKHANWALGQMQDLVALRDGILPSGAAVQPQLFGSQEQRKRWLKQYVYCRAPLFLRAFLHFFYRYIIRLGFLDGVEGLIFHFLQGCWYNFYLDAKIYEARKLGTWETERVGGHGAGTYRVAPYALRADKG